MQVVIDLPIVDALRHDRVQRRDVALQAADDCPPFLRLLQILRCRDCGKRALVRARNDGEQQEDDESLHAVHYRDASS